MHKEYTLEGITINYDVQDYNFPPFVLEKIEEFYFKLQKKSLPWKVIEDLKKLIEKFPKVPTFKNYLASAYLIFNKIDFQKNILLKTVQEHPDYIIGRLTLANYYLSIDEIELADKAINYSQNIANLIEGREIFHISEVESFYNLLFRLETEKGNYDNAENIINLLENKGIIDQEEAMENFMFIQVIKMENGLENPYLDDNENAIEPTCIKILPDNESFEKPKLQNEILYQLYKDKPYLEEKIIDDILAIDRKLLLDDLKIILKDSEIRYSYFLENEDCSYFVLHALFILKELKAEEALDEILDFLRNDEDFIDFYIGDFLTENFWEFIFKTSLEQPVKLKDFLLEPGIYGFAKNVVFEAMTQQALNYPEKKPVLIKLWKECLDFFNTKQEDDNVISSVFFSFFVADILFFDKNLFENGVKEMFEKNWIDETVAGNFEKIYNKAKIPKRDEVDIKTFYENEKSYFGE